MLKPSMYQIQMKSESLGAPKNTSAYTLVVGIAKRAREITGQAVAAREKEKAERQVKEGETVKIRIEDKFERKPVPAAENPVSVAVDEFATGKYRLAPMDSDSVQ